MIKEIYCKLPSDTNYERRIETEDEAEQILQQIKMVLGTKQGQVLGSYDFGIDLQKYLFQMQYSQQQILYTVNTALARYVRFDTDKWTVYADVSWGHDVSAGYEYAVIDVIINQNKRLGILVSHQ